MEVVCCIYRKPRAFDESSSEESSSDEDSGPEDDGSARLANGNGNAHRRARSHRHHLHQHGEDGTCPADGSRGVNELEERPEPNAYERAPGKGKGKAD
jgi:protein phosphatase 1 regulatory subunit 11